MQTRAHEEAFGSRFEKTLDEKMGHADFPDDAGDFNMSSSGIQSPAIEVDRAALSIHKLLPLAILYFFFNRVGLPIPLTYTILLAPLLFLWLYREGMRWLTLKFLICLSPFIVAHAILGVESPVDYVRSSVLLWAVFITVFACCWALLKCRRLDRLFEQLIVLNFFAAMAAVVLLPTSASQFLWSGQSSLVGGSDSTRLQLLTLEPSEYAGLIAPLLIFAFLRLFQHPGKRNFIYAAMVAVPMLFSQSLGGITMCTAALGVALIPAYSRLLKQPRSILILALIVLLIVGILIVPNSISDRFLQVETGADSSAHSRTDNGLIFAYAIAASKSIWWGVGLGQAKLLNPSEVGVAGVGFTSGVIPNFISGNLAQLGIVSVLVTFGLEIYLFFRTRAYRNPFRLAMFVFAFLEQLTGANIVDVQFYLIWCFAFAPFFPELDRKKATQVGPAEIRGGARDPAEIGGLI